MPPIQGSLSPQQSYQPSTSGVLASAGRALGGMWGAGNALRQAVWGTAAPAAPAATKTYVDTLTHNYNEAKRELDERKAECRNDLRALTLCCVVAVCGASAFMQLAVILWPVAVVMIWGALEVGWEVFGAYRNHCAARAAAQGRANEALKLLREEQGRCTQDLRAQNRLQATQTAHLMLQQPAVAARPNH